MSQDHEQTAFAKLVERIGHHHAKQRMEMQAHYSALMLRGFHLHVHMEEFPAIAWLIKTLLKSTGMWPIAVKNASRYQIIEHTVSIPHLPDTFDGFRILHLSDLHIEGMIDKGHALQSIVATLEYDLCVMTGPLPHLWPL